MRQPERRNLVACVNNQPCPREGGGGKHVAPAARALLCATHRASVVLDHERVGHALEVRMISHGPKRFLEACRRPHVRQPTRLCGLVSADSRGAMRPRARGRRRTSTNLTSAPSDWPCIVAHTSSSTAIRPAGRCGRMRRCSTETCTAIAALVTACNMLMRARDDCWLGCLPWTRSVRTRPCC